MNHATCGLCLAAGLLFLAGCAEDPAPSLVLATPVSTPSTAIPTPTPTVPVDPPADPLVEPTTVVDPLAPVAAETPQPVAPVATLPEQPQAATPPEETPPVEETTSAPINPTPVNLPPVKRPVVRNGKLQQVGFDDLKFEIEKGGKFERSMLTEKIEALKGQKIRIKGYMLPSYQNSGLTSFILVRDNMECCFGPGAMIYDCINVEMASGKSSNFYVTPVSVEGVFDIEPYEDEDGNLLVLYHLSGESVR